MSRRAKGQDSGSLELLLDTICNTFGGILFISLLVVILLNTTSKTNGSAAPSQNSQLAMAEAELRRQDLTHELETLRQAASQMESVQTTLVSQAVIDFAMQLEQAQREQVERTIENSQAQGAISDTQQVINDQSVGDHEREQKLTAARKQAAAMEKRIQDAIAQRSGEAVIPKVAPSDLREYIYYLKNGRLYGPYKYSDDMKEIVVDKETKRIEIKNEAGGVIVNPNGKPGKFAIKFAKYLRPLQHKAVVCVWPDSYEHWTIVRRAISELGLKYRLWPLEEGEWLYIGNFEPSDSSAQG